MALREPIFTRRRWAEESLPVPAKKRTWQGYLLNQDDQRRIDAMVGKALLDPTFCEQLLNRCDISLLEEFDFRMEVVTWLCSIKADSLTEFAEAVTVH